MLTFRYLLRRETLPEVPYISVLQSIQLLFVTTTSVSKSAPKEIPFKQFFYMNRFRTIPLRHARHHFHAYPLPPRSPALDQDKRGPLVGYLLL